MSKIIRVFKVAEDGYLAEATNFVRTGLEKKKCPANLKMRSVLLAEEIIVAFANHGDPDMEIEICINKRLSDIFVEISAPGRESDTKFLSTVPGKENSSLLMEEDDPKVEKIIRATILKAQGGKMRYTHENGINSVSLAVGKAERSSLVRTLFALVLGIAVGLIFNSFVPRPVVEAVSTYALNPFKTMFMSALQIIVGPVVFFSLVTCLSQFKNLAELGRIFAKVMGMYMLTTLLAAFVALGMSNLIRPGVWGSGLSIIGNQVVDVNTAVDTSLLTTIINIVPNNFVKPFLESDTLQLLFLALLCGIAVGAIGEHSKKLAGLFEALNDLFLTITTMIAKFIPIAAFCSIVLMITEMGPETIGSLLSMLGTFFASIACMILIYGIIVAVVARLNPVIFYKKVKEGMLTALALSSSSASMPTNMAICTEKLGVSPKIASFSIPLGATVNMDGTTVNLIVSGLFLARMCGVTVSGSALATMILTVVLLSLGAPGVPGSGIVMVGIVLESIGVPLEAVALLMAIDPFLDMFDTMNNVTGDMAVTTVVAKTEGLLDTNIYNKTM
ncbi:MAG: dicarboxylate/amino acid:cation symporter [Lachnospiraceae bacterium]|nr:dicarboxylate/amino acid:cation symporter [Lachnospiraceae bacterium]MBR4807796.1 dicarboxylate/amino acid:cation symporter [Lachnospiraceae bacterium]